MIPATHAEGIWQISQGLHLDVVEELAENPGHGRGRCTRKQAEIKDEHLTATRVTMTALQDVGKSVYV